MAASGTETKALREGSAAKRAAILGAARELFLGEGYDRTSMDAVAARAGVSKRTVYDYYGDKDALLLAVFEHVASSIIAVIRTALENDLADVTDLASLESGLLAFARGIAQSTLGSSDYLALSQLTRSEAAHLPALRDHWINDAPEDMLAERFAELDTAGLLEAPNPRRAADHFIVLSFSQAYSTNATPARGEVLDEQIVDGVRVFLRAYAARQNSGAQGAE
jgi:TetR/AcrR family transcriptional repressor of mexJK operon